MKICVAMPVWNEAEEIVEFITKLEGSMHKLYPIFIVIDDCSTDGTLDALTSIDPTRFNVIVERNAINLGHGPNTLRGLRRALYEHPDAVTAIDGDGQFRGIDVAKCLSEFLATGSDVLEGVRRRRDEIWFRQILTHLTKVLVWLQCGQFPSDANALLRIYKPETLESLLN